MMLRNVLLTQIMDQLTVQPITIEDGNEVELAAERAYECLEETFDTQSEGPLYEALRMCKLAWPEDIYLHRHIEILIKEFS